MAREQPNQLSGGIDDRKCAENPNRFCVDQFQNVADELLRRNVDGILNQAVNVVLDAAHFGKLLPLGHVVVNQPQRAVQSHGDRHPGLGNRIHVRRDHRDMELQPFGELSFEVRVAWEDFRVAGSPA